MFEDLKERLPNSALAFRGYNVTNLGRTLGLLSHPRFGAIMEEYLRRGSQLACDTLERPIDLIARVRRKEETSLESFDEAVALIVMTELAQLKMLEEFFEISYKKARYSYGYSLGEVTALIAGGVYHEKDALPLLLLLAKECAALAPNTTMGVLFSRGPELDMAEVERFCALINQEGRGMIAVSSILAPNTVLLLGQGDTVDRFQATMKQHFSYPVHLRKNKDVWPPLHTPMLWLNGIVNRGALALQTLPGNFQKPVPDILSLVTGKFSYTDYNSREIMIHWLDHPQRLWDAVYQTLSMGIETVVHVGPEPNLIPATFKRLSDNVTAQLNAHTWNSLGLRAISGIARRPWLTRMLSSKAALLRAPFVEQVILEDWLLEHDGPMGTPKPLVERRETSHETTPTSAADSVSQAGAASVEGTSAGSFVSPDESSLLK